MKDKIKIVAISGSLRPNSSNTNILRLVASMVPANVELIFYEGLGGLPHFNPVLDDENSSEPVRQFRHLLALSDGVIICTPEYAFGVPGSLKNALDWTVSSGEFVNKPVALITASLAGEKAHASLLETFTALSAKIEKRSTLLVPFIRSKLNEKGEVNDPGLLASLQELVHYFIAGIGKRQIDDSGL